MGVGETRMIWSSMSGRRRMVWVVILLVCLFSGLEAVSTCWFRGFLYVISCLWLAFLRTWHIRFHHLNMFCKYVNRKLQRWSLSDCPDWSPESTQQDSACSAGPIWDNRAQTSNLETEFLLGLELPPAFGASLKAVVFFLIFLTFNRWGRRLRSLDRHWNALTVLLFEVKFYRKHQLLYRNCIWSEISNLLIWNQPLLWEDFSRYDDHRIFWVERHPQGS